MDFRAHTAQPLSVHTRMTAGMHGQALIRMLFHFPQPGQLFMRFAFGAGMGMARHQAVLVMHNMPLPVMFHMDVRILFRVQPDFFPTHRVFHGKLVETPSAVVAGCGHAFEHRAAFIFRQFIRRHGTRVVQDDPGPLPERKL